MTPFADYLRVTVPITDFPTLRNDLSLDVLSHFGTDASADYVPLPGTDGATVTFMAIRGVGLVSFPGQCLTALREKNLFGTLLAVLMCRPHRVTRLDATADWFGLPAEPFIRDIFAKGRDGGVRVTRKAVARDAVSLQESVCADGSSSLLCYLGGRRQTRVKVYDKARERWKNAGIVPDGEITRFEATARSEIRMTLADAYEPAALFWHLVAPDVLESPPGVPSWVPHADGFSMEKTPTPLPAARAKRVVSNSADLDLLGRISCDMGDADGLALVQRWASRRIEQAHWAERQRRLLRAS